jgi:ribosomal protein S18 acetylase RimI-like enzyme
MNMSDHSQQYRIIQATEVSEALYQACQRLVPQLTSNNPPPTRQQLANLLSEGKSILFLAQHQDYADEIIGLATLVLYRVPTGMRGIIEDVVVDEKARGRHIGEALTHACLERAEQAGCPQVMLTSNPGRTAANRLYQRMGFELRRTNAYRYSFMRG